MWLRRFKEEMVAYTLWQLDNWTPRTSICFGGLLGYGPYQASDKEYHVYIRLNRNICNPKLASWFLKEIVFPYIPQRMHDGITISRLLKKEYIEVARCSELNPVYDGYPWIKVTCDINKITMDDFFIFLNLVRMPQDTPHCIILMKELMTQGYPQDFSLLVGLSTHGKSGHDILDRSCWTYRDAIPKKLREYDFEKRWEDLGKNKTPPISIQRKTINVRDVFMNGLWKESPPQEIYKYGPRGEIINPRDTGVYFDPKERLLKAYNEIA